MSCKTVLTGNWAALAAKAGGVGALAEALEVSPRQIHRWGTGASTPTRGAAHSVRVLAAALGVPSPVAPVPRDIYRLDKV